MQAPLISHAFAPLPCESRKESPAKRCGESDGFIDETVVSQFIARGAYGRSQAKTADMVLASSVEDYAGFARPASSPFQRALSAPRADRRMPGEPAARMSPEPGIGTPYEGGHRWWLFGMSGALTCGILSLSILSLAGSKGEFAIPASGRVAAQLVAPPAAAEETPPPPALTTVLPAAH